MVSSQVRVAAVYATLSFFAIYSLSYIFDLTFSNSFKDLPRNPDFSFYKPVETLSAKQFPIRMSYLHRGHTTSFSPEVSSSLVHHATYASFSDDPNRRVILIGDIHGMNKPFHRLLQEVSYDPSNDVLIHLGDFMAKSPLAHSLAVLSYMSDNNITGVRGNHDQAIIEWRGWLKWITSLPGGTEWLQSEHQSWQKAHSKGIKLKIWQEQQRNTGNKKWWNRIPKDWKLFGDHFSVAENMRDEDYEYLLRLPLKLHAPDAHVFLIHAGLLASDPRYPPSSKRQPLARLPVIASTFRKIAKEYGVSEQSEIFDNSKKVMRYLQEAAILRDVPQNNDPWVNLNMRSVANARIKRNRKGTPWASLWNRDMSHCEGYDSVQGDKALPCYPSTVIYGHAAARGLDINQWSFGLDTGCVYKRQLTALILQAGDHLSEWDMNSIVDWDEDDEFPQLDERGEEMNEMPADDEDNDEDEGAGDADEDELGDDGENDAKKQTRIVPFGDKMKARIISISCG